MFAVNYCHIATADSELYRKQTLINVIGPAENCGSGWSVLIVELFPPSHPSSLALLPSEPCEAVQWQTLQKMSGVCIIWSNPRSDRNCSCFFFNYNENVNEGIFRVQYKMSSIDSIYGIMMNSKNNNYQLLLNLSLFFKNGKNLGYREALIDYSKKWMGPIHTVNVKILFHSLATYKQ